MPWPAIVLYYLTKLAMPAAVGYAATGMIKWSGQNVYQTSIIDAQKREQMELDYLELQQRGLELANKTDYLNYLKEQSDFDRHYQSFNLQMQQSRLEQDIYEHEIDWYREIDSSHRELQSDMLKIGMVEAGEQSRIAAQAAMQGQRLQADADMLTTSLQQKYIERNIYLNQRIFDQTHSILGDIGSEEDLFMYAYILTELERRIITEETLSTSNINYPAIREGNPDDLFYYNEGIPEV